MNEQQRLQQEISKRMEGMTVRELRLLLAFMMGIAQAEK